MSDRRISKTKKAIREAFISQLKYKDLNQISVTQIADIANIGRGTFYLHYLDTIDLYEKIANELFEGIEHFFDEAYPSNDSDNLKKLMSELIYFISKNRSLFLIFLRQEGSEKTISKFKNLFNEKIVQESIKIFDKDEKNKEYLTIESTFIISGIVGVIDKWLNEGLIMQNEQIIKILHNILMRFNTLNY